MSEHYYTEKPTVAHDRRIVETVLRGKTMKFVTDAGVFAKEGIDFGSRLLIETMEFPPDARVLDVGCGYGPIGICAAMLAERGMVTLVDVNERALRLAEENARLNGVRNVRVLPGDLFSPLGGETFSHILSNPPIRAGKRVVHRLFADAYDHLTGGGELWIVIRKQQGAPSALAKLEEIYDEVQVKERKKGYFVYCAKKLT